MPTSASPLRHTIYFFFIYSILAVRNSKIKISISKKNIVYIYIYIYIYTKGMGAQWTYLFENIYFFFHKSNKK